MEMGDPGRAAAPAVKEGRGRRVEAGRAGAARLAQPAAVAPAGAAAEAHHVFQIWWKRALTDHLRSMALESAKRGAGLAGPTELGGLASDT